MIRGAGQLRGFLLGLVAAGIGAFLLFEAPWRETEPRQIAPRGELAPQEETTIALFEAARGSVVSITTESRVLDPWSRRAMEVPRGTGSGELWLNLVFEWFEGWRRIWLNYCCETACQPKEIHHHGND
jgi:hypothetical protein